MSDASELAPTPQPGAALLEGQLRARERIAVEQFKPSRPPLRETWWRYLVSALAIAFAVFPAIYIVSTAFNPNPTLSASTIMPQGFTLDNFREILGSDQEPYVKWYATTMTVAGVTAILTVILGALGAYAFSRFRFRGRRTGMLTLLLVQMFPVFLAFVAIYLLMLRVSDIFPHVGLNTRSGLILVYLGGVLGINAWLMKGFFDSIPGELDESARVDGATATQIFWIVILPLAAPVLAVIGLLSFIATLNEYVIASVLLQSPDKFTLSVGLFTYVSREYGQQWGPFCAGVVMMAVPVVILFLFLQRFIVQGMQGSVKG